LRTLLAILILFSAWLPFAEAQEINLADTAVQEEIRFMQHLSNQGNNRDVLYGTLQLLQYPEVLHNTLKDSVCFLRGWSFYQMKTADSAFVYFDKVSRSSALGNKSFYYGIFNRIYAGFLDEADSLLLNDTTVLLRNLNLTDRAGIALLKKDLNAFDRLSPSFNLDDYTLSAEHKNLMLMADTLRRYPKKSGAVAAIMSAVLPGSGKVYAGKTAQGIATFLETAALGVAAAEYYHKSGPESAGFIVFGTLFSFFYIGNIWGSALAVKVNRTEFYERIDENIMVDLHVPLRRIFN
jgi:hypothetical protein